MDCIYIVLTHEEHSHSVFVLYIQHLSYYILMDMLENILGFHILPKETLPYRQAIIKPSPPVNGRAIISGKPQQVTL